MTGSASRSAIPRALLGALLVLVAAFAIRAITGRLHDPDLGTRLTGVLLGFVVMVSANAVPKALTPLAGLRCPPAEEQALRRFTGWALVLGGLAYAIAWIVVPLAHAALVAGGLLGTTVLLVIARVALLRSGGTRT